MVNEVIRKVYKTFLENRILSRWFVLMIDLLIISCATVISYLLSLQMYKNFGVIQHPNLWIFLQISILPNFIFFLICRTHQGIIRYSTTHEFFRVLVSLFLSSIVIFIILYKFIGPSGSVALAYACTLFMGSLVGLFSFRIFVVYVYQVMSMRYRSHPPVSVFLWGANHSNFVFAKSLNNSESKYRIKGLVDKNINKKLRYITNLPVLDISDNKSLARLEGKGVLFANEEIIGEKKKLIEFLINRKISVYITQQIDIKDSEQLATATHQIRSVQIEDLLGRQQIDISMDEIASNVKNKTILVTGAAGSIGSEITRQLAAFNPSCIICLDQAETPLNSLNLDLKKEYPNINFFTVIGDIRNRERIKNIFDRYQPDIVYHAAAYKHVPMMENNPCEAIQTNVAGTKILVDLSVRYNVDMFVMVSTDKAVNPTNIMGASKRIAEIYVQSTAMSLKNKANSKTKFVTTRFGNVLGSNGSVIPLFRQQIEKGGPLTVTHPDIIRYFMTIPEACRLVLEASVIGESGYIYIFDMGEPVKIYDLALRMIKLAGLTPEEDIKIEFSGLRPGEKLYEELLADEESSEKTSHEKVMKSKVREYDYNEVAPLINSIITLGMQESVYKMVSSMKKLVPEYISNNSEFESLDKVKEDNVNQFFG